MKKCIGVLFLLAGIVLTACNESDKVPEPVICPESLYCEDVAVLSLDETGANFGYGHWNESSSDLILICSETDFEKYSIEDRELFSEIDFNKNTLVLIQNRASKGIHSMNIYLGKWESILSYLVIAEIKHYDTTESPQWRAALLAPIIPKDSEIVLSTLQIKW